MTKDIIPERYMNLGGIAFHLMGDLEAAYELHGRARAMMDQLNTVNVHENEQAWHVFRFRDGSFIKVKTFYGVQSAEIYVPPAIVEKGKREIEHKVEDVMPVACFEMIYANNFQGYYACLTLDWDPYFVIPIDEDRPYRADLYDDLNADGDLNQIPEFILELFLDGSIKEELFELTEISIQDEHDDYYSLSDVEFTGGYFDPGYIDYDIVPAWFSMSDLTGHSCAVSLGCAMEDYDEGPPDPGYWNQGTYSYIPGPVYVEEGFDTFNSRCADPESIYCGGCLPPEFMWGQFQTFEAEWARHYESGLTLAGSTIVSYTSGWGYIITGEADCWSGTSSSTRIDWMDAIDYYCLGSCIVSGVEGYIEDTTYMIFWRDYTYNYNVEDTISPWNFGPYNNDHTPAPDPGETQSYWCKINTEKGSMVFQFAEPFTGLAADVPEYSLYEYSIWDFYGEPVFIYCILERRGGEEKFLYGAVYDNTLYQAEYDAESWWAHDIDGSIAMWGEYGSGYARAIGRRMYRVSKEEMPE